MDYFEIPTGNLWHMQMEMFISKYIYKQMEMLISQIHTQTHTYGHKETT